jgi:nicotinamidase/pyrazinamidase
LEKNNALLIIDVQNDFCPGGALPVMEGDEVIEPINVLSAKFKKVVATQDWHPVNHISFAKNHRKEPYEIILIDGIEQVLWPEHCVPGTWGADFPEKLDTKNIDLIVRNGNNPAIDAYSTFLENDKKTETGLHYYLQGLGIKNIYLCGLATDYCVYYSAMDGVNYGFNTHVIIDATRGINIPSGNIKRAVDDMLEHGVKIISYESL